jgi:hypothetical protein
MQTQSRGQSVWFEEKAMRISKSNRQKAQYLISLLDNPECFAPANLQKLLRHIAVQPALQWISLSRNNDVVLHSCCPGKDWLIEQFRNGIVVERYDPPFSQKGYFYQYVGTIVGRAIEKPNRPYLMTLPVKFFTYLLNERAKSAAAAKARRDQAAMRAGEALLQMPGVTSTDAWI